MTEVKVGRTYRHFKGMLIEVLYIAMDSEDQSHKLVVYKHLEKPEEIWVRDYDMFLSPVDKEKYPDIEQVNRFELVDWYDRKNRRHHL